ncbi:MAG: transposase [Victivallales bacterium]|nr:transposase [Victivallales bacterium]
MEFINENDPTLKRTMHLPHSLRKNIIQFVTFSEKDSVPEYILKRWKYELQLLKDSQAGGSQLSSMIAEMNDAVQWKTRRRELATRIEKYCHTYQSGGRFGDPNIAQIILDALRFKESQGLIELLAWSIMPNHVHLMWLLNHTTCGKVLGPMKSFTAKRINEYCHSSGSVYMPDYYDVDICYEKQFYRVLQYILDNPSNGAGNPLFTGAKENLVW